MHTKGYAAPLTKEALSGARSLIERAEALGEPPQDPLLLFSILYGFWATNFVAFDGDALLSLAAEFLALAKGRGTTIPLMIGHRIMATSLMSTGDLAAALMHRDQAFALYDPAVHQPLATRFGQDVGVVVLCFRSWTKWLLGYPEAALADAEHAVRDGRETGQAATLMYAAARAPLECGNYAAGTALIDELVALADDKGTVFWKASGMARSWLVQLHSVTSDN
jgi:hypothetical protein